MREILYESALKCKQKGDLLSSSLLTLTHGYFNEPNPEKLSSNNKNVRYNGDRL